MSNLPILTPAQIFKSFITKLNSQPKPKKKVFEVREYQQVAKKSVIDGLLNPKVRELLLALCAGGGKTYISKTIVDEITKLKGLGYKIAFCSPYNSITGQTTDYFEGCGLYQTGSKKRPDKGSNVTLFTMQTFENMFIVQKSKPLLDLNYDFIILDEVQLMQTKVERLQEKIKKEGLKTKLLMLSATPYDGGGYLLPIVEKAKVVLDWKFANAKEYIKGGHLLPVVVKQLAKTPVNESHLKTNNKGEDFTEETHEEALKNSVDVVRTVKPHLGHYSTIVVATNIEHAEKIAKDFIEEGYSVKCLHSKVDGKKDDILEEFKRGEFQIIVSVRMISVGTDMPIAVNLVVATLIASLAVWIQTVARVQRIGGGSNVAYVYDLFGNADRLGSPLQLVRPLPSSEKATRKNQKCENCGESFSLTLISSEIDNGVNWKIYTKTCCGEEVVKGQELESCVCESCQTQFLVEETYRVDTEIKANCSVCKTPNTIELITPYELTTLVRDRGEFELQMFSIYKDSLRESQYESFRKTLTVYSVFADDEDLVKSLDLALRDSLTVKEKIEHINLILGQAKVYTKRYQTLMLLFKKPNFEVDEMRVVAKIIEEGYELFKEGYIPRLNNRLHHWGITGEKEIDYKKLKRNLKSHLTYIKKTTPTLKEQ